MNSVMPGTTASVGWSRRMTSLADASRRAIGFRLMSTRPLFIVVLVPSTPMNDDRLSTAGSRRMMCASCSCSRAISGNDTACADSEIPWITPVSWIGKNPFGMTTYR